MLTTAPTPVSTAQPNKRGFVERDRAVDLDQRAARDRRVFGEHRAAQMMVDRLADMRDAPRARQQRAGAVGGGTGLAQRRTAFGAGRAMAATGHEDHDHVVADLQVGDAFAQFLDDAGGLMAQRHRHRPRAVAVDHRQVRMAQPRGDDLDQHLAGAGRRQVDRLDRQRPRCRVRRCKTHLLENGGLDLHREAPWGVAVAATRSRSSSTSTRVFSE